MNQIYLVSISYEPTVFLMKVPSENAPLTSKSKLSAIFVNLGSKAKAPKDFNVNIIGGCDKKKCDIGFSLGEIK